MADGEIVVAEAPLGWDITTVGNLIDRLNSSNNIGKEKADVCLIKYKGEVWKLEKQKGVL